LSLYQYFFDYSAKFFPKQTNNLIKKDSLSASKLLVLLVKFILIQIPHLMHPWWK